MRRSIADLKDGVRLGSITKVVNKLKFVVLGIAAIVAVSAAIITVARQGGIACSFASDFNFYPYAFIDAEVPDDLQKTNALFDTLTSNFLRRGILNRSDPATAMDIRLHGEQNTTRYMRQYRQMDGSVLSVSFLEKHSTPESVSTPYDRNKRYLVIGLGYAAEGVGKAYISAKVIQLAKLLQTDCVATSVPCVIRARLVGYSSYNH